METVQEKKPTTAHNVVCCLEEFISSNRHAREEGLRWLSSHIGEAFLPLMRMARTDSFDGASRAQINAFRLAEIEKQKTDLQKSIETLDVEARKIQAEMPRQFA